MRDGVRRAFAGVIEIRCTDPRPARLVLPRPPSQMCDAEPLMRILAVSDETRTPLYNAEILRMHASDVKLVLSCGDLPHTYLDFIASVLNRPLWFVRGNHDYDCAQEPRPPVCEGNLDNKVVKDQGLLIGGLEGSMRYKPGQAQYTDSEMWAKVVGMMPRLVLNRLVHGRAIDILVTHAPPYGIHDQPDLTHRGFRAFLRFMEWFKPAYLLHGHVHVYDSRAITTTRYLRTQVVNVYPWRIIEVDRTPVDSYAWRVRRLRERDPQRDQRE